MRDTLRKVRPLAKHQLACAYDQGGRKTLGSISTDRRAIRVAKRQKRLWLNGRLDQLRDLRHFRTITTR